MQLRQGSTLQGGKYRIEKVLGQGGFGITYLAERKTIIKDGLGEIETQIKVTIKEFFMKDLCDRDRDTSHVTVGSSGSRELVEKFKAKFIKEAKNIAKLKHDHIIKVLDVFEENDTAYYVMEYISGGSLSEHTAHCGALVEREALHYIRQIADALGYIHEQKINHLDVKPSNILLKEGAVAVLIDFGLAKQYDGAGEQTSSTPVGVSKGYAPMEQYKAGGVSSFSPTSDIYSLGATLYKLITGTTPPEASDLLNDGLPELPSTISSKTRDAITSSMEPIKKMRPQSISAFLDILGGSADTDETTITLKPQPAPEPKQSPRPEPKSSPKPEPEVSQPAPKENDIRNITAFFVAALLIIIIGYLLKSSPKDIEQPITANRTTSTDRNYVTLSQDVAPTSNNKVEQNQATSLGVVAAEAKAGEERIAKEKAAEAKVEQERIAKEKAVALQALYSMVYVSGGTFQMGSNDSDAYDWEKPVHSVTVSSYYIGRYEVTQQLWQDVIGSNPSTSKGSNKPVTDVSWYDCVKFCNALSRKAGLDECYDISGNDVRLNIGRNGYRLPTEAEWEFAARGGNNSKGYKYSGSNSLDDVAWYGISAKTLHAVGFLKANELGIYDMSGNVWEWCHDWYTNYSSNSQTNPTGAISGSGRVLRGGSYFGDAGYCRSANRNFITPADSSYRLGLRLVRRP